MITKLVRTSARMSFKIINSTKYTFSKQLLPKIDFVNNKLYVGNSISVIRSYVDQVKQNSSQIEDKILEIIRNFDRIKENPANPAVII